MKNVSLNLSNKIETRTLEILEDVYNTASKLNIEFFVVGATARDIIFEYRYNIETGRKTDDIDLGINIKTWNQYDTFTIQLCDQAKFKPTKLVHRFTYDKCPIDIIPFGLIADKVKNISWPSDKKVKMSLLGFEEAYLNSFSVTIKNDPLIEIQIVSPVGFAILKLIAWADRNDLHKDAQDFKLVIKNYADLDNDERIFEIDEIVNQDEIDYEKAGAMLLGYDIANICQKQTLDRIIEILDSETGKTGHFKLIEHMGSIHSINNFQTKLDLLKSVRKGIDCL